jgi:hypothetical protein
MANNRGMVAHMHRKLKSAVEAESAELLMQSAQAELPPAAQNDARLVPARGVSMDKGAEPHEFDQRERLWNRELRQEAEWDDGARQDGGVAACDGPHDADAAAPVVAHASAPSDEVLPEQDAAVARGVAPASGTGASTGYTVISSAVPADAATCAPAAAVAVAYYCNGAASASQRCRCVRRSRGACSKHADRCERGCEAAASSVHTADATAATAATADLGALEAWRRKEKRDNDRRTVEASP